MLRASLRGDDPECGSACRSARQRTAGGARIDRRQRDHAARWRRRRLRVSDRPECNERPRRSRRDRRLDRRRGRQPRLRRRRPEQRGKLQRAAGRKYREIRTERQRPIARTRAGRSQTGLLQRRDRHDRRPGDPGRHHRGRQYRLRRRGGIRARSDGCPDLV